MSDPIEYLDLDDLIDLARKLLGDPPPFRDLGLLGSAAARDVDRVIGRARIHHQDFIAKGCRTNAVGNAIRFVAGDDAG